MRDVKRQKGKAELNLRHAEINKYLMETAIE